MVRDRFKRRTDVVRYEPSHSAGRVPPHDLDAEAAVLSTLLIKPDVFDTLGDFLKAEHFYSEANEKVFEAIGKLSEAREKIDIVSVAAYLRDREQIAQVGGAKYLAQLSDATPAVAHVESHGRIVYEKWRIRQLIATCQRIAAEGYGDVGVAQKFIDEAEQNIYQLARGIARAEAQSVGSIAKGVFATMVSNADRGDRTTGISTGYDRLDAKIAGLNAGDLIIVAGRPGQGKTSFVMNLSVNVAAPMVKKIQNPHGSGYIDVDCAGYGVTVCSLEMPKEQLVQRVMCAEARVDFDRVRKNILLEDDWRRMTDVAPFVAGLPIMIDDSPSMGLLEVRARVRRHQAEYNRPATAETPERRVGVVVVDYLQLMKGREGVPSREQEISEISRGLKAMAKELGVAVIALSQLNRAVETRSKKDKRPQLADLRESGSIEQDADAVIFIYRDEYYNPETTNAKGIAELIIAKQRNGPTGKVLTRFTGTCMRFDNLAAGDYPEMEDE